MALRRSAEKWRRGEILLLAAPLLVIVLATGWLHLSNILLPPPPPIELKGHTDLVYDCAFSPDNKALATGSGDGTVKLWDTTTGALRHTLTGHRGEIKGVAFSANGQYVLGGGWYGTPNKARYIGGGVLHLWDAHTGTLLWTQLLDGATNAINRVAFDPNSERFAAGMSAGTIAIGDATTGKVLRRLPGTTGIFSLTFAPHGDLLASNDKLWDLKIGHSLRLVGYPDETVAFSRDGQVFAIGRRDGIIELQEVRTGKLIWKQPVPNASANSSVQLAFSTNGRIPSHSNTDVSLWNVQTGDLQRSIDNDRSVGGRGVFSPDGEMFALSYGRDPLLWHFIK